MEEQKDNQSKPDISVFNKPKNLSEKESQDLLNQKIDEEYGFIAQSLEQHHGLFAQIWAMGSPRLTWKVPTAAVSFNQEGQHIEFLFNPLFWKETDRYTKSFIICHEALHVILSHGLRTKDCDLKELANKALDVVVNHMLTGKFGFSRKALNIGTHPDDHPTHAGKKIELCWIDTVFPGSKNKVKLNKSFEYYYRILEDETKFVDGELCYNSNAKPSQGSGSGNNQSKDFQPITGNTLDDHDHLDGFDESDIKKQISDYINENLDEESKNDFVEKMESTEEAAEAEEAEQKAAQNNPEGQRAGSIAGNILYRASTDRVRPKRKWETVIKKWSRKYKPKDNETDQWTKRNRRFTSISKSMILPTSDEALGKVEDRIDVWFFQDTSGSCYGFRDRFFDAAKSLPKDRFNMKLFCFDTQVYETSLESGELKGFGGTSFRIIEQFIQGEIAAGRAKYPKAVFVITDGFGDEVTPEHPELWYWFLDQKYDHYIPKESSVFLLQDYE